MTLEEVQNLMGVALQVKVAVLRGWLEIDLAKECSEPGLFPTGDTLVGTTPHGTVLRMLPDYSNNLNATQELKHWLVSEQPDGMIQRFLGHLTTIATKGWVRPIQACALASARQEAQAFVMTMTEVQDEKANA